MESHKFMASDFQNKGFSWDIPDKILKGWFFQFRLRLCMDAAQAGGDTFKTSLQFCIQPKAPAAANSYTELLKSFTSADTPVQTPNKWASAAWTIASTRFGTANAGGKIALWFSSSGSVGTPNLKFGEAKGIWLPPGYEYVIEPAEGFSFL
jgi:hypothetical protein